MLPVLIYSLGITFKHILECQSQHHFPLNSNSEMDGSGRREQRQILLVNRRHLVVLV